MRAVFESALERPVCERGPFVMSACGGDASLAADVGEMLSAHEHVGTFLQSAVVHTALLADTLGPHTVASDAGDLSGRVVSHYRLLDRLGAGGMGVVYRATDVALGRSVAIKVLRASFTMALRGTLLCETEACARLQHPAIATYFESGEIDDRAFIAMELVAGQTLRERLMAGPLRVDEAIAVAHCLLEALAHAHAAGILHCDIKPSNIMLTSSRQAKLLDFGLAKHLLASGPDAATPDATAPSIIAGTVGYMSPEQILGAPLDARSDVFQVGAVLYEMLAGRPAFPGTTAIARVESVLSAERRQVDALGVPPGVAALVARALSRRPEDRYPTVAAMLRDLIAASRNEWLPALPETLAILDFENRSDEAGDAWIGSGLADSLSADLASAPGMTVVRRDVVVEALARLRPDAPASRAIDVGLALGCRWVLSGEYRRCDDVLRLTAHMIEVAPGRVAAVKELEGSMSGLFTMQHTVAEFAAASSSATAIAAPPTRPALSVFECYARGQRLFRRLEKGSLDQAMELFERATELDPRYAPALSGLARFHAMRYIYTTDRSTLERAASYAKRAIEADPASGEPHVWLGYVLWRMGTLAEADAALRRARERDASSYWGPYFGATLAHLLGRHDEALELSRRATELDPKATSAWYGLGSLHLELGNEVEALSSYVRARRVNALPDASPFPDVGAYIAECHRRAGRLDEARASCLQALDAIEKSDHMYRDSFRVHALIVLGFVALDQLDQSAGSAAFAQAIAHVRGRPHTLAGGWLVVRALAGLACCGDAASYEEARRVLAARSEFDFSWLWQCEETTASDDLARAAALGRLLCGTGDGNVLH